MIGGDDFLQPGAGNDIVVGGGTSVWPTRGGSIAGLDNGYFSDTVSYSDAPASVEVSLVFFAPEQGRATGGSGTDLLYLIDNVIGSAFDDIITGGDDPFSLTRYHVGYDSLIGFNHLEGRGGNDQLFGLTGQDFLEGGDGDDLLDAGGDNDRLSGGSGDDVMRGGAGDDVLFGGEGGVNTLDGGDGVDVVSFETLGSVSYDMAAGGQPGSGADTWISIEGLQGGAGADHFWGDAAANRLIGGLGNDVLRGRDGADELFGGDGDDILEGGAGDDVLWAGQGNDILDGGDDVDFASFSWSVSGVSFSLAAPADGDTYISIEGIIGSVGDDTLIGDAGNNILLGGAGDDELRGGSGDDTLDGQAGLNSLYGEDGNDTLLVRQESVVDGGAGDDAVLVYGLVFSTISGGDGFDTLEFHYGVSAHNRTIEGFERLGAGGISMTQSQLMQFSEIYVVEQEFPSSTDLTLWGASNVDLSSRLGSASIRVSGSTSADIIWLGDGNDVLRGGWGPAGDELHAGGGDDTLIGQGGDDLLDGGDGMDTASFAEETEHVFAHLGWRYAAGSAFLGSGAADIGQDVLVSIEALIGGAGNDILIAGDGPATLSGGGGSDWVEGGAGDDVLSGGEGVDAILGAGGADSLHGGAGDDGVIGGAGNDALAGDDGSDWLEGGDGDDIGNGGAGVDVLLGGAGNDTLSGEADNDFVVGDDGDDTLNGDDGDDWLDGLAGSDVLNGGAGNDALFGGAGANIYNGGDGDDGLIGGGDAEVMNGGSGADWLQGWGGADQLTGGAGGDSFVYTTNQDSLTTAMDRILDFNRAEGDVIRLTEIDANWLADGDQAFTIVGAFSNSAGQMTAAYNTGTNITLLSFDMNGDSLADMAIEVVGDVTAADNFFL